MIPLQQHYLDLVAGYFAQTSAADLRKVFEALQADQAGEHLVIHFHGGLVSRDSAVAAATALLPAYREAGAYPLFFIWNSDVWTTITANVGSIVQERAFLRLVRRIVQMAAGAVGDEGDKGGVGLDVPTLQEVPEAPEDLEQFAAASEPRDQKMSPLTDPQRRWVEEQLKNDPVLQEEQARIAAGVRGVEEGSKSAQATAAPLRTSMSPKVKQAIASEAGEEGEKAVSVFWTLARYGVEILSAVIGRYLAGRHHGLYTTVVQETLRAVYLETLGVIAWNMMKKNTEDAFGEDPLFCGGRAVLLHLKNSWDRKIKRVTLIGHSTGAIYIGHFLEYAHAVLPADVKFDVIFLAPACSFRFVHKRLDVFKSRVRTLRIFGLKDERERSYWEVPGLFRCSLLYIVAGLLEEDEVDLPLLGMQRYHTREWPYQSEEVSAVLDWLPGQPVWAIANEGPGRESAAILHGSFDREPRTLASVQHVLRGKA